MRAAERAAQRIARAIDRIGIDFFCDFARDVGLAGQMQRQGGERRVDAPRERIGDNRAIGGDEAASRTMAPYPRESRPPSAAKAGSPGSEGPPNG